jgi:hypothetical protein
MTWTKLQVKPCRRRLSFALDEYVDVCLGFVVKDRQRLVIARPSPCVIFTFEVINPWRARAMKTAGRMPFTRLSKGFDATHIRLLQPLPEFIGQPRAR